MADPIAPPGVEAPVDVAVPEALNAINNAVRAGGQDPKANIAAANDIQAKIAQDETGHINTTSQWGAVVANLLMRDYKGALNAYNGGQTEDIEGRTATGQKFYKQYNARGYTGKMYDINGKELNADQQAHVEQNMGGVFTPRDQSVLQSGLFKGLSNSEIARVTGLSNQVVGSMKTAYETSQIASRMNQGLVELDSLTKKLSGKEGSANVLDLIHNAPADVRAAIFRFKTGQQTTAAGTTAGKTKSESGSSTTQDTGTVSGNIGKRLVGGNISATETKSGTAGESRGTEIGETASKSAAGQEDIQSKILGYVQSKVNPEQAKDVMRWIQLTQMVNESQANLEKSPERAPGVVSVAPTELGLTDAKSSFENNINLRRNNALEAAWSSFVSHNVRQGRQNIGGDEMRKEFMDTNTYKGIQNMYNYEAETNKSGKRPEVKEGTVHVNEKNRPVIYRNGKWEDVNVR